MDIKFVQIVNSVHSTIICWFSTGAHVRLSLSLFLYLSYLVDSQHIRMRSAFLFCTDGNHELCLRSGFHVFIEICVWDRMWKTEFGIQNAINMLDARYMTLNALYRAHNGFPWNWEPLKCWFRIEHLTKCLRLACLMSNV